MWQSTRCQPARAGYVYALPRTVRLTENTVFCASSNLCHHGCLGPRRFQLLQQRLRLLQVGGVKALVNQP